MILSTLENGKVIKTEKVFLDFDIKCDVLVVGAGSAGIYAADAAEDYEGDRLSGKYNPYVLLYNSAELTKENKESIKCALLLECKNIEGAVNLLPFGERRIIENIIKNIIYLGLVKRIEFLDGKEDVKKENKEKDQ